MHSSTSPSPPPYYPQGIPGPLRCQVWQLLTTASFDPQLVDAYRLLITMVTAPFSWPLTGESTTHYFAPPPPNPLPQESPTKDVIVWDIKRTYVAHEFFREPSGREALEKISKAYSVYDEEVGYCQGLSFIVAVLLLQVGLPLLYLVSSCALLHNSYTVVLTPQPSCWK